MPEIERRINIDKENVRNNPPGDYHYSDSVTLVAWRAPGRPYKQHSREYFINIALITVAIEIIVFLFHMDLLMLVILTLAFLAIVLAVVPPHMFDYRITTEGVKIEDVFYIWEELYDFYFEKHNGVEVVKIGTKDYFPGELTLIVGGNVTIKEIKETLIGFLPFREYVEPTFMQKAGDWLGKTFPLEKTTT